MKKTSYFEVAEQKTWSELRSLCSRSYNTCLSLHIPMNLPFAQNLFYQTPAFEYLYMPCPRRKDRRPDRAKGGEYEKAQPLLLNFLFGEPAFIPDYRLTQLSYAEDEAPILKSSFFFHDLYYETESFIAPPLPGQDPVMHIRFSIKNTGVESYPGTVRLHLSRPDSDLMYNTYWVMARDNEYIPLNDTFATFTEDGFATENVSRVKVCGIDGWDYRQEEMYSCHPDEYQKVEVYGTHHHFFRIQKQHRVYAAKRLLQFSRMVNPQEEFSFTVLMDASGNGLPGEVEDYDIARARCKKYYAELLSRDGTRFDFGSEQLNAVCRHNLFQTLQTIRDPGLEDGTLALVQGYTCNRSMWNYEAGCMFEGLLHFGYFDVARRFAELVLKWQDSDCKPLGVFSSLDGAIGNTGPGWASTTGDALRFLASYLRFSGDKEFYKKYRNNMLRAAKWILNEVAATRKNSSNPAAGLMPVSKGSDEDAGYFFVASDNRSLAGLFAYLELDLVQSEPEYPELRRQTLLYRDTLRKLIESLQRPDGFIPRSLPLENEVEFQNSDVKTQSNVFRQISKTVHFQKFDAIDGAFNLTKGRVFHPEEQITKAVYHYFEKNYFREFWTSPMDEDCIYVGPSDQVALENYLVTGKWKKAWGTMKYLLEYGRSMDLDLTFERFSLSEPAFVGLQINESENGRQFSMLIACLYMPYQTLSGENAIVLLGGIAPFELEDNPERLLEIYTQDGKLRLEVHAGELHFSREKPLTVGTRIRLPEHFPFVFSAEDASKFSSVGENEWSVQQETADFSGIVSIAR